MGRAVRRVWPPHRLPRASLLHRHLWRCQRVLAQLWGTSLRSLAVWQLRIELVRKLCAANAICTNAVCSHGYLQPNCVTRCRTKRAHRLCAQTLIFLRTCVGFGIAGAHVAYTLFMEFLAPGHRGVWLTAIESFWTVGSLFLAGMAWVVLRKDGLGWQGLVVIAAIPLVLLMALYPWMKESPHWLLAGGHTAKAQVRACALHLCGAQRV
jgi:hypothetical protein